MSIDTKELRRIAMEYWANDSKISLYPKEVIDICDTLDRQSAEIAKLNEAHRWIPVSERFPEINEDNLPPISRVVYIHGKDKCVWLAFWDGESWNNANSSDKIWMNGEYVTHWMPLPDPTELDSDDEKE